MIYLVFYLAGFGIAWIIASARFSAWNGYEYDYAAMALASGVALFWPLMLALITADLLARAAARIAYKLGGDG